jgi:hypothetical protein
MQEGQAKLDLGRLGIFSIIIIHTSEEPAMGFGIGVNHGFPHDDNSMRGEGRQHCNSLMTINDYGDTSLLLPFHHSTVTCFFPFGH